MQKKKTHKVFKINCFYLIIFNFQFYFSNPRRARSFQINTKNVQRCKFESFKNKKRKRVELFISIFRLSLCMCAFFSHNKWQFFYSNLIWLYFFRNQIRIESHTKKNMKWRKWNNNSHLIAILNRINKWIFLKLFGKYLNTIGWRKFFV